MPALQKDDQENGQLMKNNCTFCAKLDRRSVELKPCIWDQVLFESPNFVVVPTVGAITEGWLLIVPRRHYLCFGGLEKELLPELDTLRNDVGRVLEACYGPVAIFEHGPAEPKQPVGCSVDHAHLHILSTTLDLFGGVRDVFPQDLCWKALNDFSDLMAVHKSGLPYLYVEQPIGTARWASHPDFESQIFRKVIARNVGTPERFDWRDFPEQPIVESTVATIKACLSANQTVALDSAAAAA